MVEETSFSNTFFCYIHPGYFYPKTVLAPFLSIGFPCTYKFFMTHMGSFENAESEIKSRRYVKLKILDCKSLSLMMLIPLKQW